MDSVLRGAVVYVVLLLLFRIVGKRSLAQITTFDFVLLLIIAEAIEQAMIGSDNSMIGGFLVVVTLLTMDVALSLVKQRSDRLDKLLDDVPVVLVDDGELLRDRMARERIDESDILQAARELQGLERFDQIKYAVLERSGGISIIPKQPSA
jgi:uncharacterized membrane protein YcaP (DUF421 family)